MIFTEQGRADCESWYGVARATIDRWLDERGKTRLIASRAAYVETRRKQGTWITRQTPLVEHRQIPRPKPVPIRDTRRIPFTLARHAAHYLRTVRNGGFIVSPANNGDWFVGTKRLSAAQMVDFAIKKGFQPAPHRKSHGHEPNLHSDIREKVKV